MARLVWAKITSQSRVPGVWFESLNLGSIVGLGEAFGRSSMKTRLVNYREGEINLVFPLKTGRATLGRATDNTIQLPDDKVSKHHATLRQTNEVWAIQDLESRNGVFVNGKRVTAADLKDGDCIKVGPYELYLELDVPAYDWVPSHIIDLSTHVGERTVVEDPPEKS